MRQPVPQNVLIVAASRQVSDPVLRTLASRGVRGLLVSDRGSAAAKLDAGPVQLMFVELAALAEKAMEFLACVRSESPDLPVIAVVGENATGPAVEAMRGGAQDVLTCPVRDDDLNNLLDRMLPDHEVQFAAAEAMNNCCVYRIAGRSEALLETVALARRVAASSVPVLVTGESGTGKELLAYLVHRESKRQHNPYIRVNCAAISESLLESELFGHERGAFTGAHSMRKGRFELAHGGTLLLDEISETTPRLQAELLRVLEQQDFERLGGSESINVNVRVICTSNRDLGEEVRQGRFRGDLYYRIRGVQLHIPPLRNRPDDIPGLIWHFVNLYAGETSRRIDEIDGRMLELFARYDWPGNVRQLRNAIRTALILGDGETLSLNQAPQLLEELESPRPDESPAATVTLSLQDLERQAVIEALRRTNSHQAKAAELLGISDRTLRDKIRRYKQDGHLRLAGEKSWSANLAS